MDNNGLVLTVDVGTQSTRASFFDKKGNTIDSVSIKHVPVYYSDVVGQAEHDADFYFDIACKACKKLCSKNEDKLDQIKGVGITTFRDSSVVLDKDLKPLHRVILWLDQRLFKGTINKQRLLYRAAFKIVGKSPAIELNRSKTIALWYQESKPEIWNKMHKYVALAAYLNYKFTGRLCASPSQHTGHYPLNYRKGTWYKTHTGLMSSVFGVKISAMPELVDPGTDIGPISEEVSKLTGIPVGKSVFTTGSDKACESIGAGAVSNDVATLSYGTASTVNIPSYKYIEPERFLPAYHTGIKGLYNLEQQVYRGYWTVTWFLKEFTKLQANNLLSDSDVLDELNSKLQTIPPGSDGLTLQPYWQPGLSRAFGKGAMVGWSDTHSQIHLYKAIIEGISYALKESLITMARRAHTKIKYITVSGGGASSDEICQITADIFNLPIVKVQTVETTSLGCAISLFVALKEYETAQDAVDNMVSKTKTFVPSKEASKHYEYLFSKVYCKLYPRLKSVYKALKNYGKYDK